VALENKLGDWGTSLAGRTGVDWFGSLGESVGMVTGLIFIVCVLLFRRGIVGEAQALLERGRRGRSGDAARMNPSRDREAA
jgi:branched-chain amino acid transport system permease protein